ncbi:urea ABC transporter permease subunit UrtB [Marinobacter nauticus]|uniref:Amino acid/amide ABC transporter membrane protein 1 (HAAT family) n=1 Tax=Marinobacter nauticus TaxID=2743 RepID=A0A368XMQ5_MARNT|nr:urea ABC transporter permease subunit UrtB [Marinobacter nauticus]KAE8545750.1 Urea ABC transporter, permease protein UrtB [Marinobacter nauticus]MBN8238954.1 urea ABC transporter permease subunit UrtB [Marinobacter nauticus]MBY6192519.1 urea ABC transporter permease subunit UrtB [Marinobacter nauticus]MBY6213667.1 urea ABC transporter permease subunit UrtB [Marinobacter nauticus]MBY6219739.1 urea ABC transporter permease subunit UrtB [Marinobacter nauticus]
MSIHRLLARMVLAVCLALGATLANAQAQTNAPEALLKRLVEAGQAEKTDLLKALSETGDERARGWLEAVRDGKLAMIEDTGALVIVVNNRGRNWQIADALTGEDLGEMSRRDLQSLRVNNALRADIEGILSVIDLTVADPGQRLDAARNLLGEVNEALATQLQARLQVEDNGQVRDMLTNALAIYQVEQGDVEAVATLSGSLNPTVRAALNNAVNSDDPALAAAAEEALASIEQKLKLNRAAETLYFGLSLGSVLVLAAIGLAITFGVMGVINMAHGELIMLGAYTTWGMQQLFPGQPGLALILSIPAGFLVAALAGIAIERSVIQYLKGRPLETLLATFGISLILQQLVRTVISPLNRTVVTPEWMSGSIMVNEALSLTLNRLYVIGFALVVFAGLMLIMRKTRLGLEVRAVTQNRAMARSMGIKATKVDIMTFALGSGVAGLAGVALSQITNVGPNLGQNYIIDSFMVVVFGGVGNLWGTLIAGLSLGTINQLLEPWAGAVLAKIMVLVLIILFIQKRPRGLFPQKGRAAEG